MVGRRVGMPGVGLDDENLVGESDGAGEAEGVRVGPVGLRVGNSDSSSPNKAPKSLTHFA